jgi:hypothetical protein
MPLGWEPHGRDFPCRNRLISGLSLGVVIVEAAKRSGSLITARFALEQGREVFAVPGSPLDPRAEGTNGLIKQGATPVTETADIVAVLRPSMEQKEIPAREPELQPSEAAAGEEAEPAPNERARIVSLLGPSPVQIDDLVRLSNSSPARIVDEAGQPLAGKRAAHVSRGRLHRRLIGHIEEQRDEAFAELRRETFRIGSFAHAAENAEAVGNEDFGRAPADAAGRSRYHDAAHARLPGASMNWPARSHSNGPPYYVDVSTQAKYETDSPSPDCSQRRHRSRPSV